MINESQADKQHPACTLLPAVARSMCTTRCTSHYSTNPSHCAASQQPDGYQEGTQAAHPLAGKTEHPQHPQASAALSHNTPHARAYTHEHEQMNALDPWLKAQPTEYARYVTKHSNDPQPATLPPLTQPCTQQPCRCDPPGADAPHPPHTRAATRHTSPGAMPAGTCRSSHCP